MIAATEMSISPAMISNASGKATRARSVKLKVASDNVSTFRKYGDRFENSTNSITTTTASIDSQRRNWPAFTCAVPRGWRGNTRVSGR